MIGWLFPRAEPFPECPHAGPIVAAARRECRCPQIIGLGTVDPETCRACDFRERPAVEDGPRERLADCPHLGEPTEGDRFRCRHPDHGEVTRDDCRSCADYLFPVLAPHLPEEQVVQLRSGPPREHPDGWWTWENVQRAERRLADVVRRNPPPYPGHDRDRGIVVVGGGRYLASAYVTIRVLRHLGVELPVQLWHLAGEVDGAEHLFAEHGVECVDIDALREERPFRFLDGHWWRGWQAKAYALVNAPFRSVLYLDADCYPVVDPTRLFDADEFRRHGSILWPDIPTPPPMLPEVFGVRRFRDAATESGQLMVDRERCWRELALAAHYNARADFTYRHVWGDKDTFPIAWKRCGRRYGRLWHTSQGFHEGILQYDERGEILFLHRCTGKFTLDETAFRSTPRQNGRHRNDALPLEDFCFRVLEEFRHGWRDRPHVTGSPRRAAPAISAHSRSAFEEGCRARAVGLELANSVLVRVLGHEVLHCNPADDEDTSCLRRDGFWESWVSLFLWRLVQPGWRCVDVGANVGYYTTMFARLTGAPVHAVEPQGPVADLLARSAADNGHVVYLHRCGAWDREMPLVLEPGSSTAVTRCRSAESGGDSDTELVVRGRPLDALLADESRVDLVKIDAEGAEDRIWAGMQDVVARCNPRILFEYDTRRTYRPGFLAELAERYALRHVATDGQLQPLPDSPPEGFWSMVYLSDRD